jgi:hypothetical protein
MCAVARSQALENFIRFGTVRASPPRGTIYVQKNGRYVRSRYNREYLDIVWQRCDGQRRSKGTLQDDR